MTLKTMIGAHGVDAVDATTVRFPLRTPNAEFPSLPTAYQGYVIPEDSAAMIGSAGISTGSFVLTPFTSAGPGQVDASGDYFGGRPALDSIGFYSDETRRHWRIWSDYWAIVGHRPDVAAAYAERIRTWEGCCARVVARGVAEGRYVAVDPQAAALKLAALMLGAPTQDGSRAEGD